MGLTFEVPGDPRGKGRPRFSGGHAYTDSETKAYENKIKACYQMVAKGYRFPDNASLLVEVTASLRNTKERHKGRQGLDGGKPNPPAQ